MTDALPQRTEVTSQKKPDPCSFVIFGATGDLTHRLVIPSLYNLEAAGLLPDRFCVVGVARKGMSNDDLRDSLMQGLRQFATRPVDERFVLNMADIAEVWRRGSVVSSWLLDLAASALASDPQLANFSGFVQDSGEGRWTVEAAIEEAVPAEVLTASLFTRFRSRQDHNFAEKMLSAMRFGFGGHVEAKEPGNAAASAGAIGPASTAKGK